MAYDEEEKEESIIQKFMRIIIFTLIGFLIMTALVLPIFGTLGEHTTTAVNEGANITDVQSKYASQIASMDSGTAEITWKSDGIYLEGTVSGTPVSYMITNKNGYVKDYPIVIVHPLYGYFNTIVSYNGAYNVFTSSSGSAIQTEGSIHIAQGDKVYVQDTQGTLVLTKNGVYSTDPDTVIGFGYTYNTQNDTNTFIWADGTASTTIIKE